MEVTLIPLIAFIVDLLLGEPPMRLHPTVWIGNLISKLEKQLYCQEGIVAKANGAILVFTVIGITGLAAHAVQLVIFTKLPIIPAYILTGIIASATIANKSLFNHVKPILQSLCRFDLKQARKEMGMIVGRNTEKLSREEISRASVEAISESLGDGIASPLFYLALFGLPGAFIYRAVNTMDSMLGYKSEKYINFGWAAARIDDVFNYIPARIISFPSIAFASLFTKSAYSFLDVVIHTFKFQHKHLSPNAGWLEAATARITNVSLGGVNKYGDRIVEYPQLNPTGEPARPRHLCHAIRLISIAALISALLTAGLGFFSIF